MLYQPLYIGPLCIYGRLNTEDNSSDNSLSQQTQLVPMIPQQRTGTIYRSQWSSGSAPDFSVREPLRIILPALHLSRPPLRYAVLGTGCCTVPAVPRSTQPSNRRGTVKWVSAFGLSNNNKWRWWMWMVAAYYQQILQPKSVGLVWGLAAIQRSVCIHQTRSIWKMLSPFATASYRTPHYHSPGVATAATVARRLRIDVHDDNDNAWTEGTAMAPWNGPNEPGLVNSRNGSEPW